MVNGCLLDKAWDKVKETIDIVKFHDTKSLIDTDDITRLYYFEKCCNDNKMYHQR